jgi:elongation factor Ts
LNCETDFVARTDEFQALAHEIAMQVAAMNPIAITREEIPSDVESDTEPMALMEQNSIRDGSKTVGELVQDEIAKTGENIRVARFSRFELGSSE